MHRLLLRQLARHIGPLDAVPPAWRSFLADVSAAYEQADADRALLERAMDLTSGELLETNARLRAELGERKRLEERYRSLVEATAQIVWSADATGEFAADQPQWCAFTGQDAAQARGRGWLAAVHPDDRARVAAAWDAAVAACAPCEIEHRVRGRDGAYRDMALRAVPVREPDGRVREWVGAHADVTDRRRVEQEREALIRELNAERARLQSVFQHAPAVIGIYHGPEHVVVMVNPAWETVLNRHNAIGKTMRELFPEVDSAGLFAHLDRVYQTGEPYVGREVQVMLDRGGEALEETYWDFVWQPLRDSTGAVTNVLVHAVEITDQVRARRQVEDKARQLAHLAWALELSNRELDRFAYVVSHDLKAPLRGIGYLSDWIEADLDGQVPEEVRGHLAMLRSRVARMDALIDGILAYSRAGRGRQAFEPVAVGDLLRDALELLEPVPTLTVEVAPDLPVVVTERVPLQQVFQNLLSNALKYARNGGSRVCVAARDAGEFWEFSVADDGPGIPPQFHDRIFELFQRLESRDVIEGSGIGLSLVKKIVEMRGGRVWVESAPGAGATFQFLWPKHEVRLVPPTFAPETVRGAV